MTNMRSWEKLAERVESGNSTRSQPKVVTGPSENGKSKDDLLRLVAEDIRNAIVGAELYDTRNGKPDLESVYDVVKAVAEHVLKHKEPAMQNSICCRIDEDGDLNFMLCIGGLKGDFA